MSFALSASQPASQPSQPAVDSGFPLHTITIQNVVATVNLSCRIDQRLLTQKARNAEYNPKRFAAVIMRIRDPKSTALIFESGKMVVLGAKSEALAKIAARKYAKIIKMCEHGAVGFKDFKVNNMVGVAACDFPIRLEGLVLGHARFSSYEPELFPGLIYRMVKPKLVMLIFVSGKVVMTGARSVQDLHSAFNKIYPVLQEFRKVTILAAPINGPHAPPSSSRALVATPAQGSNATSTAITATSSSTGNGDDGGSSR